MAQVPWGLIWFPHKTPALQSLRTGIGDLKIHSSPLPKMCFVMRYVKSHPASGSVHISSDRRRWMFSGWHKMWRSVNNSFTGGTRLARSRKTFRSGGAQPALGSKRASRGGRSWSYDTTAKGEARNPNPRTSKLWKWDSGNAVQEYEGAQQGRVEEGSKALHCRDWRNVVNRPQ